jgi:N-acetylglucosaminyldiphosphoundecaprenol N-acetyl-beta-D-mannosaminyltransferase
MVAAAHNRVRLFGIEIDPLAKTDAAKRLMDWVADSASRCRVVVTPNTDHVVQLRSGGPLRLVYAGADLIVADGMPVVVASRLLGQPLPERVTGADLVPALFDLATSERPLRAYLFGAGPGVAERAAAHVEQRWPHVKVVGTACPPVGFEKDATTNARHIEAINAAKPDVLVVGLGAPKQELWVHAHRHALNVKVAFCVGATIDFLAGEKPRAPMWMQRSGLEWLHRLASEPKRLFRRYATDAIVFPRMVWAEWRLSRGMRHAAR